MTAPLNRDDVGTAILWLRSNEGNEDEAGPCNRVADWLEAHVAKLDENNAIASAARELGISTKVARHALRAAANRSQSGK